MRNQIPSRVAERIRRSLGTTDLAIRLDAVEAKLREHDPKTVYLGDDTALVETRWGAMLLLDTRDSVLGPALMLYGLWETDVTNWFQDVLRPGQVFVDVGANIGYYTLLGSRLVGDAGHIFAIEAHPRMSELLNRNVIINGRFNVTTWQGAAWSQEEILKFHARRHFASNSSAGSLGDQKLEQLHDDEEVLEVRAVQLDEILSEVPRVDLIKIDVEGAEVQVVMGLAQTLKANPAVKVMFEWSPGQLEMVGNSPSALLELMHDHGFSFRLMERGLASVGAAELLETHYGNVVARRT